MRGLCAGRTMAFLRAFFLIAVALPAGSIGFVRPSLARDVVSEPLHFAIPAQPLASALEAYGALSGLDVFYNAALAEQRQSHAVMGTYTPKQAIEILLAGSGYVARATAPGGLAIVPAAITQAAKSRAGHSDARHEAYFAAMQSRIDAVLCAFPCAPCDSSDLLLRIWLQPSGDVAHADILGNGEKSNAPLATALGRARFGVPPVGMSQPVTLVVFRPAPSLDPQCTTRLGLGMLP